MQQAIKTRGAVETATKTARKLDLPHSQPGSTEPPDYLDAVALDFWRRHAQALRDADLLSPQDIDSFALLCLVWSKCRSMIADPASSWRITNDAISQFHKLAKHFSLLPDARKKNAVSFGSNVQREDGAADFEY